MKFISFPPMKSKHLYLSLLASLILCATVGLQPAQAQEKQLSLADIIIGLKSKKATLIERNKILSEGVTERGITFALTPEIETELKTTGATAELIESIRRKSPVIKVAAKSEPQPQQQQSTPVQQPEPKPVLPDFTFYQKRAEKNANSGEYDLAIVDYNKVIELSPENAMAYLGRGWVFYIRKNYAAAISDYDKAIKLNPKDSVAYYNRGVTYEKMGESGKAAEDYQKTIELDEKNQPAKDSLKRIQEEQAKNQIKSEPPPAPTEQTASEPLVMNYGQISPSQAIKMIMPVYPQFAKNINADGQVIVAVEIDEKGEVTSAKATSGHTLLRDSAEDAARRTKFKPAVIKGNAVKAVGFIVYNFKK